MVKDNIRSLDKPALLDWLQANGEKPFRADQILKWLYVRLADEFDQMTDLSKPFRAKLADHFQIERLTVSEEVTADDGTRKFLFRLQDGQTIESVLIPERSHLTLCVSTQVGCAQGCRFCLTGQSGLTRNLSSSEIVGQVWEIRKQLPEPERLTNLVFMGMGEPLANYPALIQAIEVLTDSDWGMKFATRRVTVSTSGMVPHIVDLGHDTRINLAVSLNAVDDESRSALMPINRKYPIDRLMAACREFPLQRDRKITFEYILFKDLNDSLSHAAHLAKLLRPLRCKINLIPFNPFPGCTFERPVQERIDAFQAYLIDRHFTSIVRYSKGLDILAACGQLRAGAHR